MSVPSEDLQLGNAFRDSMLPRADGYLGTYPFWYGWVIMDSFLAGIDEGRKERDAAVKKEREACLAIIDSYLCGAPSGGLGDSIRQNLMKQIRQRGQS